MRGPWTSGGIEWNSGVIGHHPGTATPVNYKSFTDEKGTVHCVVGGMDLPSHLQWRVDISLAADKSYFQTKTFWFNGSPFFQSYYHWNNAAIKSARDLHFYFPGNYWIGHNGLPHPWPVDENGIDRSWYKNSDKGGSSSNHIWGSIDNYFASFYEDENFGSGHWSASYGEPGKKIFQWSHAPNGAIWENLLTDTHGQYVEVQAGRMANQNSTSSGKTPFKQPSFIPYNTDCWTERWFPIRETEGVSRVSESGTINVKFVPDGMKVLFSPMCEIDDNLKIVVNDKQIFDDEIELNASETFKKTFKNIAKNAAVKICIGNEELYSTTYNYIISRPIKSPANSLENLYVDAVELENRRAYNKALDKYLELLKSEPLHYDALERVAEIYTRRGEYELAEKYVRKALEINTYLPEANFIYGHLMKRANNLTDAEDGFRWAMRSLEFRSAALEQIAEISLTKGNLQLAAEQAEESLSFNKLNINSYKIQAIAKRKLNKTKKAKKALNKLLEIDPLNHFALFEKHLLKSDEKSLNAFNNSFKSEMLKEEYLETGLFYYNIGLNDEAIKVLEQAPSYAITNYWLAWLNKTDNEKSDVYLKKAIDANPEFVFPYRNETLPVLKWAAKQSSAWVTDYYSALILWNRNRNEAALDYLNKWDNQPEFVPFYYSRAHLKGIGTDAALEDMQKALALGPDQWRTYNELANIYNRRGKFSSALDVAEKGHNKFKGNYILDIAYSKSLTLNGNYEKSAEVLNNTNVLPYEGENSAHNIYVYNYLMLAFDNYKKGNFDAALNLIDKSEEYPENMGSGSPSYPDYRSQNALRIKIYNKTGETQKAEKANDLIKEYNKKFGMRKRGNLYEQSFADNNVQPF
jgi:tetratricopeptide (TPR) repeat protein